MQYLILLWLWTPLPLLVLKVGKSLWILLSHLQSNVIANRKKLRDK